MTINTIYSVNLERATRWHKGNINDWSPLEWAAAMAGEAGEAANAAKKLKRMENALISINEQSRSYPDVDAACKAVAKEVADTIIYGLLLMARVGITDPEAVIREVFNEKSVEYGFPERL